jgi:hypothetical protein
MKEDIRGSTIARRFDQEEPRVQDQCSESRNQAWSTSMGDKQAGEQYSEEETEQRREDALRRMLSTPHKPHKPKKSKRTKKSD